MLDVELVRRAQGGDERAFTALAHSVLPRFLAVAHRILRDAALAEDATQHALLRAWRDLPSLRDPAKFEGWAYRLLVRACYDESRRRKRRAPEILERFSSEPRAPEALGLVHDRDQLERGLARLSVDHRAVLVLHYYLDMPLEQVAHVLDVPIGTVNSRFSRAKKALRGAIEADTSVNGQPSPSEAM